MRTTLMSVAFCLCAVVIASVGCKNDHQPTATADSPTASAVTMPVVTPTPAEPPKPTLGEIIDKEDTLAGAIKIAHPLMDEQFNRDSLGTIALASWSITHLRWSDIAVQTDETSYALARKDVDEARGKRLCTSGTIIQIELQRMPTGKEFVGLFMNYARNLFRFMAVGTTGTLVGDSQARICGVVTGLYEYSNSGGGTGHAVSLVGMFDLPENRATAKK